MTNFDQTVKQLSLSGFPFQLRVEREVLMSESNHGWRIINREHAWSSRDQAGFIDLVLQHSQLSTVRLLVECKRQRAGVSEVPHWLFLVPDGQQTQTDLVRCLSMEASGVQKGDGEGTPSTPPRGLTLFASDITSVMARIWDDVRVTPISFQSEFCVMFNDSSRGRQPMLETICAELLNSIDGLADEEIRIMGAPGADRMVRAFYFPVVVTNAELKVCQFNTESISLADGVIPVENCQIDTVPFIRFRKSMAVPQTADLPPSSLEMANRERERTVFIVNASRLSEFLCNWSVKPLNAFDGFAIQRSFR
jgi:hypothetical protein